MNDARRGEADQKALWNSNAGCPWVESQRTMDEMFAPIEALLTDAVVAVSPRAVLDIGCGTGATTLAVARRLGAASRCVGVDISEPMVTAARARAEREGTPAQFLLADAETHPFEPSSYDAIMSRFGVMFFDDSIRAFTNLRRAARNGAALRLVAWRSAEENPFMTVAERAAAPLMPDLPPRVPDAPGQFAFADAGRVRRILDESGWAGVDIRPIDVDCTLPESELTRYATRFGLVGRALESADDETRTRVVDAVRSAFEPYVHGTEVRYVAACWMIGARVS